MKRKFVTCNFVDLRFLFKMLEFIGLACTSLCPVCIGIIIVTSLIVILADANLMLIVKSKCGKKIECLSGKVVWITGASSGIGEHIAYQLASVGCKLVLSARRKEELERVKQTCLKLGRSHLQDEDVLVLPMDVLDFDYHKKAVQSVLDHFKKIDILVNNAGKSQRAVWSEVQLDVDREIFEINVLGPVSLTQAVLPHMMERKQGHLVVMSSLAGILGVPGSRSYCGSKHAVHGYFDSLRTELGNNIDITLICPGPVFSNLFQHAATGKQGELVGRNMENSEKRMSTERCAYLSCVAIANRMYEVWVSQNPILFMTYITIFLPDVGKWLASKIGAKQFLKMREGK
ncbi:dehydrogenase/reductase SDR family member 7-like isoform X3 [Biomphalaria glabrata]|uniref:Dehydrogenase/reductase SDR family member 7-like isoform X3 n=1 Tax=Biomphalaria glabrata TaxID=6526 RepID=A0A9W2ZXI7_BIOGL|nr:dehydrogenase/reductase SDR family member 7-like isoform X3 [Biomphalaria glabrata]